MRRCPLRSVRPEVVFPGAWVDETRGTDVWVLNATRLLGYVRNETGSELTAPQQERIAAALRQEQKLRPAAGR